ncbi:MAG: cobalamin biosynthesis protein [Dehalococcoidia bacterium]
MEILFILTLALFLDLLPGDPPTAVHPVGWMGKIIAFLERFNPERSKTASLIYGTVIVIFVVALFVTPVYFLLGYLEETNQIIYIIVGALLLKLTISLKGLGHSAQNIRHRLEKDDLAGARSYIPALVSRNPDDLDQHQTVAATVESVAENTSDSFVAPLFWFLVLGIPGAVGYRVVSTFDSMIGYRGGYEYIGKFAARLDDVLNLIPARLTAVMIVAASFPAQKKVRSAWRTMMKEHSKTQSPNAGWPMAAAAGALEVQLEKPGHYKLGKPVKRLTIRTINQMVIIMYLVAAIWILVCFATEGVKIAFTP